MVNAQTSVPRIALRVDEAAASIGVSRESFDLYVADDLRWIRRGRLKLVPVTELQRWVDRNAALTLPDPLRHRSGGGDA